MGIVLGEQPAHFGGGRHPAVSCALMSHLLLSKTQALARTALQIDTGPGEPQAPGAPLTAPTALVLSLHQSPVLPDSQRTTGFLALLGMLQIPQIQSYYLLNMHVLSTSSLGMRIGVQNLKSALRTRLQ